ncbi:MAG: hypothetical protein ACKOHG_07665, partial [Planctomycetia bacterium]
MRSSTIRLILLLTMAGVLAGRACRAEDAAAGEPAADGTVSVVVAPPAAGRAEQPAESVATNVLSQALEPLEDGAPAAGTRPSVYARPLPLVEALERSGDRARRLWISQAYWKVSAVYAVLRWSTDALERLELIAPGGDPHDRAVLDVALAAARADLADARAAHIAAQQDLVDLVRLPARDPLPWPVDTPLAGP